MHRLLHSHRAAALLATVALAGSATPQQVDLAPAEDRSGWVEFVVPTLADDTTGGSPIDLSWLNDRPAGASGWLRADGDRIVDGNGDEVRLAGTNICDWHVMPPPELAEPIARRLAELGLNFIRLHYQDYTTAANGGLMNDDMLTLDPGQLDRMDRLVAALIAHGIYVDLNLHVARRYPGTPNDWNEMSKGLDRVSQRFVEMQKQYARDLLTHVNPYTGRAYADEPGIAVVEINNENSAMLPWADVHRAQYANLPDELAAPLRARWNAWLAERYDGAEALRAAWLPEAEAGGGELITGGAVPAGPVGGADTGWSLETSNGGAGSLGTDRDAPGGLAAVWHVQRSGQRDWAHQLHHHSVAVEEGVNYVIRFEAAGAPGASMRVALQQEGGTWGTVLGPTLVELSPGMETYEIGGTVRGVDGLPIRLSFDALNTEGKIAIRGVSLRSGTLDPLAGVDDADPAAGGLPLPGAVTTPAMLRDFDAFVMDRELETSAELVSFVRDELGYGGLIWDSQAAYGGTFGLLRESRLADVIDMHGYPFHPEGERAPDGTFTWSIEQGSAFGEGLGRAATMAYYRLDDRPFFVSEFDINPPNDHAVDSYPVLALHAAHQGWAGFGEYSWLNFQQDYNPDRIHSAFATTGHAGQMATIPTAALMYRLGLVAPAADTTTLHIHEHTLREGPFALAAMDGVWNDHGIQAVDAWQARLAVDLRPGAGETSVSGVPAERGDTLTSDTGQITVLRDADAADDDGLGGGRRVHVNAPAYRAAIGSHDGQPIVLGDVTLTVQPTTRNGYAHVHVVSLDGAPLADAKRLLVTTLARVENAGMAFGADRTTAGPDYGEGPTLAEPVSASVTLPGTGWTASRLDGSGRVAGGVPMDGSTLDTARHPGVWFLLERE